MASVQKARNADWPCSGADECSTSTGNYVVTIAHEDSEQDFVATADNDGRQAGDDDCAEFTVNQTGTKTATDGGSTNCWGR